MVLPFWYRLTQVILEKRPLNGCCCVGVQESLKVELSLAEARVESSRRKIEAEMQMHLEQQVTVSSFCLICVNFCDLYFLFYLPCLC